MSIIKNNTIYVYCVIVLHESNALSWFHCKKIKLTHNQHFVLSICLLVNSTFHI